MSGDYHGLVTRSLGNEHLRLEFLLEAGPRVVRLFLAGNDENQLAELPDEHWATPFGDYYLRGGHRLWRAPERFPESSLPDNAPIQIEELVDGVRLLQPVEGATGLVKSIEVHLDAERPALTVLHELQNDGMATITLAPWAITALPPGGIAILPLSKGPADQDRLAPNRNLVLWPYTHWDDARLEVKDNCILVHATSDSTPLKIGHLNHCGWVGYLRRDLLFVKRFEPNVGRPHPDLECNAEVYTRQRFLELETLGPVQQLRPCESAVHRERWEWYSGAAARAILDDSHIQVDP
jgi:hypothetical protein